MTARQADTAGHARSYTSGTSDRPLLGLTIGDMFDQTVERHADNEALVLRHQNLRYTYRELREEVDRAARALIALGVEKGQRVGIWAPNCAEWTITQFATAKIGAILVNINPSYRLTEVRYGHPKVQDVQVIGVPDEKLGEEIMAWVKLRVGETATVEEIRDHSRGKIAHYNIPRYVRFVDGFLMTVTGKVQKFLMREESVAALGLEKAAAVRMA